MRSSTFSGWPAGMTYKAAISGVNLGGGKSVIIGDPGSEKSDSLLEAMGRFIEGMGGEYIAGQDIGTGSRDMAVLSVESRDTYHACLATPAVREIHPTQQRTASPAAFERSSRR